METIVGSSHPKPFVNKLFFVTRIKDPLIRSTHDLTRKICRRSPEEGEIDRGENTKLPSSYRINTRAKDEQFDPTVRPREKQNLIDSLRTKKVKSGRGCKVRELRLPSIRKEFYRNFTIVPSALLLFFFYKWKREEGKGSCLNISKGKREVRTQKGLGNNDINRR